MFVGALIGIVTPGVKYVCWCFYCHRHTGVNMFFGALIVIVTRS
jgi:hypothetical protein